MKKIAFHIQKGGTGKTTLSGNCGAYLSRDIKVCLIDCDPQASLSSWFIKSGLKYELSDYLQEKASIEDVILSLSKNLSLIPSVSIDGSLKQFAETQLIKQIYAFVDLTEAIEKLNYDLLIFDLGPRMGILERHVIMSLDEIICPVLPEFFSFDGIEIFNNELKQINRNYRADVKFKKITCNMVNKSFRRHLEYIDELKKMDYELFMVPQDSQLAEAQIFGKSIFDYNAQSRSVPDIEKLSKAIMGE